MVLDNLMGEVLGFVKTELLETQQRKDLLELVPKQVDLPVFVSSKSLDGEVE